MNKFKFIILFLCLFVIISSFYLALVIPVLNISKIVILSIICIVCLIISIVIIQNPK